MENESLYQLISACLMDGEITAKEKEVLLSKAQSLGYNPDEFEILLKAKEIQYNRAQPVSSESNDSDKPMNYPQTPPSIPTTSAQHSNPIPEKKDGVKYCPVCGTQLNSFQIQCHQCGNLLGNSEKDERSVSLVTTTDKDRNEKSPYSAKKQLEELIDFSLSDGKLSEKEIAFLYKQSFSLGVDVEEFEQLLNAKRHLFEIKDDKSEDNRSSEREKEHGRLSIMGILKKLLNNDSSNKSGVISSGSRKEDSLSNLTKATMFQHSLCEWAGNLRFEDRSSDINSNIQEVLDVLIAYMKAFDDIVITVESYVANGKHIQFFNKRLTAKRAKEICQYLISKDIPSKRVIDIGLGGDAEKSFTRFSMSPINESDSLVAAKMNLFQYSFESILKSVEFLKGSDMLLDSSKNKLDLLAAYLLIYPKELIIRNHTYKGIKDNSFYMTLTTSRAITIHNYLVSKGVETRRIQHVGMGADATNQMTEFIFV